MSSMQEITEFVENIQIKKTFLGGYDRRDVELKIDTLCAMFEKVLKDEREKHQTELNECESTIQTSKMLVTEMNKKLVAMTEEQSKMKGVYKEYCSNILKQYSESLRTLSTEFTQILENITSLQNNMIELEVFDEIELAIEDKENKAAEEETN